MAAVALMVPFFELPVVRIGPFDVATFGLTALLGILVFLPIMMQRSAREGLATKFIPDATFWVAIIAMVGAHWFELFYHPSRFLSAGPVELLKVWDGLASMGAVFAGYAGILVYFKIKHLDYDAYTDAMAQSIPIGWGIARLGCFLVHDHIGARTDFFLAVAFPLGARHDLGLYDALLLFAIGAVLNGLCRVPRFRRRLWGLLLLSYGMGRFGFDFLRARDLTDAWVDPRYLGLTPAQYGCVVLFGIGVWWVWFKPRVVVPAACG